MPIDFGSLNRIRRGNQSFSQMSNLAQLPPEIVIDLGPLDGGMDTSQAAQEPDMLQPPVKSPYSVNTLLRNGVVRKTFGLTEFGIASTATDKNIMAIAEYELFSGTKFIMRVLNARLERWNGTAWLALPGTALQGAVSRFPDTLVMEDLFIVANGVDVLKRWDGVDANSVVALSASAPVGLYLAQQLGRLVVADITTAGPVRNRERILVSDNANYTLFGAGNADDITLPDDSTENPSPIQELTSLFGRLFIYRLHSIWIALPTGIAKTPFRFEEHAVDVGLLSSKTVSRYEPVGDIFLGSDRQVYTFLGGSAPVPVGFPIHQDILDNLVSFDRAQGRVDLVNHQYWLMGPTGGAQFSNRAWVWEIDPWITQKRLVWSIRTLPTELICIGFGDIPNPLGPGFLNDENRLLNDIPELINDWQLNSPVLRTLVFGDTVGKTRFLDESAVVDQGFSSLVAVHDLPAIGAPGNSMVLDFVEIQYRCTDTHGAVEISFSEDGGTLFQFPVVATLPASSRGSIVRVPIDRNFEQFQARLKISNETRAEIAKVTFRGRSRGLTR